MNTYYYPETLKNITKSLMGLFNEIKVKKYDENNTLIKTVSVPITFGPLDKFYAQRKEDESGKPYFLQLPRLALTLDGINYNSERASGVNEIRWFYNEALELHDVSSFFADPQPTPYDYYFTLHIRTESIDHFSQILENILPYFNPALYMRVKEFSFLNVERDLPVSLTNISPQFIDDIDINSRKFVNGTIGMIVQGFMYYPVSSSAIVKHIKSKYLITGETDSYQVSQYDTSGVQATSAGLIDTSAIPRNYDTSGYDATTNVYWFTSSQNFPA